MTEENASPDNMNSDSYDAADRPFDFIGVGSATALICDSDPSTREKIKAAIAELGYQITEAQATKDAVKNMRFHVYDLICVNDNFDAGQDDTKTMNSVLSYVENLAMSTRRQIFVVLIGDRYRTMDNMAAFNKSVNLVLNPKNLDDAGTIIKKAMDDNEAFYYVYKDSMKKLGKI